MLSGLDLLGGTSTQSAKTGLDLLQGIAPAKGDTQVKTGLALLKQQVGTEAPTTTAPLVKEPVHPAQAYLEKFTKPPASELEAAKYEMGPLITAENVAPAMDTLGRLWNLAQHPYDVVKGSAMFASGIPGFIGGLASAIGQIPIEVLKGGSVLDWYNASAKNMQTISGMWHEGVSAPLGKLLDTPEKMGEELAQTMFGAEPEVHKDESELIGEIFMVPYTAASAPIHALADSPTWDNHPNVKGILKFSADALGLVTMGLFLHGGPIVAARRVDPIVKKAHEIDGREKVIDVSGLDEVVKTAQKKLLDAEKTQLDLEAAAVKDKLDHEKLAKENLKEKGEEVEAIREGRLKFAGERALIEKLPEGIKPISKTTIGTHFSSNIESLSEGIKQRDLGFSVARNLSEERYSPRLQEPKGTKGRVSVEVSGRGLDYNNPVHRKYIKDLFDEVEVIGKGPYDIAILNRLRSEGIDWIDNFNGIGKSEELHVINQDMVRIVDIDIKVTKPGTKEFPKIPEARSKTGIKLIKKEPKPVEPVTDVDFQTGLKESPSLATETSPFRDTPERTQIMKDIYAEKAEAVRNNPELMTSKLLNDMNRWLDGEDLLVEKTKNDLSELAARADELQKMFRSSTDFDHWKVTTSNAATWARKADRLKIEQTLPSVDLNIMVPLDRIPKAIAGIYRGLKIVKLGDLFRNKELFDKTGFWYGKDFKWRYEIDDSKAKFREFKLGLIQAFNTETGAKYKLGDILDYPELYKEFPEIKDMDIEVPRRGVDSESLGTYFPDRDTIRLNQPTKESLLHELQHYINEKTGAFLGTNKVDIELKELRKRLGYLRDNTKYEETKQKAIEILSDMRDQSGIDWYWNKLMPFVKQFENQDVYNHMNFPTGAKELYYRTPGEMEARLVEARRDMSLEERTEIPPWETLDDMLSREGIRRDVGTKLYTGLPLDEVVKQLKSMVKHTAEFMKEFDDSFKEKEFDFAHSVKQVKADTVRSLWDQSETLLNMVRDKYPNEYERVVTRQRSAVTGIGYGKALYGQAVKEIYGGKTKGMIRAINAYVLARRFKDIYGYRTEKGYKHQPGYGTDQTVTTTAVIEMIKDIPSEAWKELSGKVPEIETLFGKLTPKEMAEVVKAGEAYFEWSRRIVDDLVEVGIKSHEEGVLLKSHDYRKFKTMLIKKIFDFDYDLNMRGETIPVTGSGVQSLGAGSTKILEGDSRVVLSEQMARAYGSIAHQRAVLEWKALADKHSDNGFVSVKKQSGWSPMPYMVDGVRKNIYFHPDVVKYLVTRSRDLSPRLAMAIRAITMAPVTKGLAVGLSPIWSTLSGLPMDVMHSLWAARTWEADAKGIKLKATYPFYETKQGKFKNVYSPFMGVGELQLGHDMKRTLGDVYGRGPLTTNLMKHGLVMNFLTQRQNRYMKGVKPPGDWAKMMDLISYHGLTTELWVRVATADRVIRRDAKKLGITYEQALKNDDIMYRAAHAGRDRMDYNQGGWLVKALDQSGMIFLNAAVLGTRTFWRQAKDNPVDFAFRTAQIGLTAAGVTAAVWSLYPETMKDMSEKGNRRDVTWPIAPNWLRVKDPDGDDVTFYGKLRMDPSAAILYRFFEGLTRTYMYDKGLTRVEPDYHELVRSIKQLGPIDVKAPPHAQFWYDYVTNYKWWADRQMYTQLGGKTLDWSESRHEGEFDERIPQMAKDIGKVTGMSPARLSGAISNIIPSNNEFVWLTGKAYEQAFSDVPKEVRAQHWLITLAETPGFSKVIGMTRHGQGRWKVKSDIEDKIELETMVRNSKFDMLATRNAWYGVKNNERLLKFMKEQDFDVYNKMTSDLKFIKDPVVKSLPHRDFWLSMKHSSIKGRAKIWVELLDRSSEGEKAQLLDEMNQVMVIGGIVTPEFMEEVGKIKSP